MGFYYRDNSTQHMKDNFLFQKQDISQFWIKSVSNGTIRPCQLYCYVYILWKYKLQVLYLYVDKALDHLRPATTECLLF